MDGQKTVKITKQQPTNFPDGFGVKSTKEQEMIIVDFFIMGENVANIFSSIALTKSMAEELANNIQKALRDLENDNTNIQQ